MNYSALLVKRRTEAAILLHGMERPTSLDKVIEVVIISEELKPEDDVFVDDQIW